MDKNVEINLNEVVASTRQSASYIGSLLGKTFGKVECQLTWPGGKDKFEEAKNLASASNSLMLNMSPKRYTVRLIDIKGVNYVTEGLGDSQRIAIAVNLKENGESDFKCPLNGTNPIIVEKSMRDAINDALRGTGKNFFVAIDETVSVLNEANKGTLAEIDALIKTLQGQRQSVETAISENLRKAAEYKRQWSESKIDNLEIKGNASDADAIINVHTAE
jgi:hypothetical protein